MFKINVVAVGKIKEDFFKKAVEEYLKRLKRFADVKEITFSKEEGQKNAILLKEEEKILPLLKGRVIALAIEGKNLSSEEFSKTFQKYKEQGVSEITFLIGSSYGLSEKIKKSADFLLSFSKILFR